MLGWKLLTHDFRPPIQGGAPLFDGVTFPYTLPTVDCDTSGRHCSFGWNFVHTIADGFHIAEMWPTGRPCAVLQVEADAPLERGDSHTRYSVTMLRSPDLTLLRHATDDEIRTAIYDFSAIFGDLRDAMAAERWLWWQALKRPHRDRTAVEAGLRKMLDARRLDWELQEFPFDAYIYRALGLLWVPESAWNARNVTEAALG